MSVGISKLEFAGHERKNVREVDVQGGYVADICTVYRNMAWRCLHSAIDREISHPIANGAELTENELHDQETTVLEYRQQAFAQQRGYSFEGLWEEIRDRTDETTIGLLESNRRMSHEDIARTIMQVVSEFLRAALKKK